MAKTVKTASTEPAPSAPKVALLIELDNIAVRGQRIAMRVLRDLLADKDAELDAATFARYCVDVPPPQRLSGLLKAMKKTRLSAPKLQTDFEEAFRAAIVDPDLKIEPWAGQLVRAAREKSILTGALSDLAADAARPLAERLGLEEPDKRLFPSSRPDGNLASPGAWHDLARKLGLHPVSCTAVTTSAATTQAALAAGMRCAALPDEFTSFQDFGGADLLIDTLDDDAIKAILALVVPRL